MAAGFCAWATPGNTARRAASKKRRMAKILAHRYWSGERREHFVSSVHSPILIGNRRGPECRMNVAGCASVTSDERDRVHDERVRQRHLLEQPSVAEGMPDSTLALLDACEREMRPPWFVFRREAQPGTSQVD